MNPYGGQGGQGGNPYGGQQQGYPPQQGYPQQQQGYPQQQQFGGGQPGYGGPAPAMPPKKKGMSGCLLAFLIVLGLTIVGGSIIGWLVWREVGGLVGGVAEIAGIMTDAAKAPGTKEMKSDAGCDEAMAIDVDRLTTAINKMEAEIAKKEGRDPKPMDDFTKDGTKYLVTCIVKKSDPPKCADVAKAFIDGASPKEKFLVTVTKNSKEGETVCGEIYDEDGKLMGKGKAPTIPTK